ncbi:MAG TPA: hypothetical protein VFM29_07665 [Vicinamibacteria bacterium]|nr:hypothetical protein [Vicinamibacteria bacterium]
MRKLILVPALLTLGVTVLRLAGELLGWSNRLFNRDAGGGAAPVGIVWLIPVFGVYFARKLMDAGQRPASAGKAVLRALAAFAFNTVALVAAVMSGASPVVQLAIFAVTSYAAIAIARPGWPALVRVLVAYGFAARIPVLVVMFLSIFLHWDTHYAKPRPDFPPMGEWGLFFWTALLPQLSVWIYMTVVMGLFFGGIAAAFRGRRAAPGERTSAAAA